jgi:hypothetical protein
VPTPAPAPQPEPYAGETPLRSALPFLFPFAAGALVALYLFVEFDDDKAGFLAVLLAIGGIVTALTMNEESRDRAFGPRLAALTGGQSLALRWTNDILGQAWRVDSRFLPRWIVGREESWGSLYLLRVRIGKMAHETQLVLNLHGSELPALSARRKGPARRQSDGRAEEWDVTSTPGTDEQLVTWIVEAVQPLEAAAFQLDGKKLWCRVRDSGAAYLGDNSAERLRALTTIVDRAGELGRELRRFQR